MSASIFKALAAATCLLAAAPAAAAKMPQPKVDFIYPGPHGTIFDRICKEWLHRDMNPADVKELLARKVEFEAHWEKTGRTEQLAKLRDYYASRKEPTYIRAWEIVDKEGVAAVVGDTGVKP